MTTYDNAGMPGGQPNYDAPIQSQQSGILDYDYVKSLKGILKAVEIVICLITVITSSVWESKVGTTGGGWVQFVSTTALILTAILYVLYFVSVAEKLRSSIGIYSLVELIYNGVVELCFFISAIIAAVYGSHHAAIGASAEFGYYGGVLVCYLISGIIAAVFGFRHPSIGASAFFCFAALVPYGIDCVYAFQTYRNQIPPPPSLPPQQTPGTIDNMERGPQY